MVGMIGPHCPRIRRCLQWFGLWRRLIHIFAMSADALIPPAVAEDPALVVSYGSSVSAAAQVPRLLWRLLRSHP